MIKEVKLILKHERNSNNYFLKVRENKYIRLSWVYTVTLHIHRNLNDTFKIYSESSLSSMNNQRAIILLLNLAYDIVERREN